MERLAQLQAPQEPPPPDLDALWDTLTPSLQAALDAREERVVEFVKAELQKVIR
ncbi:MAG: hypothetical protein PHS14_17400 [Elusimicrobia bacterium]|nr:hypothetical protein [Elusimicrobiota bacterium]